MTHTSGRHPGADKPETKLYREAIGPAVRVQNELHARIQADEPPEHASSLFDLYRAVITGMERLVYELDDHRAALEELIEVCPGFVEPHPDLVG